MEGNDGWEEGGKGEGVEGACGKDDCEVKGCQSG